MLKLFSVTLFAHPDGIGTERTYNIASANALVAGTAAIKHHNSLPPSVKIFEAYEWSITSIVKLHDINRIATE